MSMELTAKALKTKVGSASTKLVLVCMADIANNEGSCFPSYQYIADLCEMSKRSVIEHIKKLEQIGIISKHERKTPNGNSSNVYKITIKGGEKSAPPSANGSPPSEIPAPPPSENPAPRTSHSFEPINEPKDESTPLNEWIAYRKAMKKPISEKAREKLEAKFQRYTPEQQKAVVDHSIENDYRGLFFEKLENSNGSRGKQTIPGQPKSAAARVSQRNQRAYEEAIAREQGDTSIHTVSGQVHPQVDFSDR